MPTDLRYEDMEKEDIDMFMKRFNWMSGNRWNIRKRKSIDEVNEVHMKLIQVFVERFKR